MAGCLTRQLVAIKTAGQSGHVPRELARFVLPFVFDSFRRRSPICSAWCLAQACSLSTLQSGGYHDMSSWNVEAYIMLPTFVQPAKATRVTRAGEILVTYCASGAWGVQVLRSHQTLQCSKATTRSTYDVLLISKGSAANKRVRPDRRMVMQASFLTGSTTPRHCRRCGMVRREVTGCGVVDSNTPL